MGSFNVAFTASIDASNLQTLLVSLYSVSYKASWQNEPVQVYSWSIGNPESLSDHDPNPQGTFFYSLDLKHVPVGPQQIEVTAVGGGYGFGGGSNNYNQFTANVSSTLYFTISSPPIPPASSTTLGWNVQTVDENAAGSGNSPIAVDSHNITHIAYADYNDIDSPYTAVLVKYATWNGVSWSTQAIAEGTVDSLVLDANGNPHILFTNSFENMIRSLFTD